MKKTQLLRYPSAAKRSPAVDAWMRAHRGELGAIAQRWFELMRGCGDDVRELIHDGAPTACVDDAGFAYVNAFTAHVNVGFFRGASLADPARLLEGTGKFMRHVKLRPGRDVDEEALRRLIEDAYADMRRRVEGEREACRETRVPSAGSRSRGARATGSADPDPTRRADPRSRWPSARAAPGLAAGVPARISFPAILKMNVSFTYAPPSPTQGARACSFATASRSATGRFVRRSRRAPKHRARSRGAAAPGIAAAAAFL